MKGIIATDHPTVTQAACDMLESGGNAFDAAIAAGFAATVAEPVLASLGGGGFLLARTFDEQEILFDFFTDTPGLGQQVVDLEPHFVPIKVKFPSSQQDFNVGYGSIAVPGTLKGFIHVHEKLGCLPLEEVITPAVELARNGVLLNKSQSYFLKLLHPIMTLLPGGRKLYEPNGKFLQEGDLYKNSELANFLEWLPSSGVREFYHGKLAKQIVTDCNENNGLITKEDLTTYQVMERKPLEIQYRNCRLLTNPPPSFGGSLISILLRLLQVNSLEKIPFGSARHLAFLSTVFKEAERYKMESMDNGTWISDELSPESIKRIRIASGGTTHISVCDSQNNFASMSISNGEGSGYVVPGSGIMLNNMLGEDDLHPGGFHSSPAGFRISSMMSPSILFQENVPNLVLGSGGSKRIKTALLQVLSNFIDFDMSISEAVEAPRIHWDGTSIQMEAGFDKKATKELANHWETNVWSVKDIYFGGVNALSTSGVSVGDSRRGGSAKVLD